MPYKDKEQRREYLRQWHLEHREERLAKDKLRREKPEYKELSSHHKSIIMAVKEEVTSRIGKTAGYGLSHIKRFIEVNEGKMYILSGKGKILWDYTGLKKIREKKQTMHYPFDGTIINLEINAEKEGLYFLESEEEYF